MPSHVMGYCSQCEETFTKYHELEYHIKVKHLVMKEKNSDASDKLIKLEVEIDNDRISSVIEIEDDEDNDINDDAKNEQNTKRKRRSGKAAHKEKSVCDSPKVKVEKGEKQQVKTRNKVKKEHQENKLINVEVTDAGDLR